MRGLEKKLHGKGTSTTKSVSWGRTSQLCETKKTKNNLDKPQKKKIIMNNEENPKNTPTKKRLGNPRNTTENKKP